MALMLMSQVDLIMLLVNIQVMSSIQVPVLIQTVMQTTQLLCRLPKLKKMVVQIVLYLLEAPTIVVELPLPVPMVR